MAEARAVATLLIRRAGILTTVQDLGRAGWGRFGVPASGAMDALAARTANALVGNDLTAAVLELTGPGAALTVSLPDEPPRWVAVAGADLDATITDGAGQARPLPMGRAVPVTDGETLTFPRRRAGARAIVSVAGGFAVPRTFASAATDVANQLGGWQGRPLRAGDALPIANASLPAAVRRVTPDDWLPAVLIAPYADPFVLRFIALSSAATNAASFTEATYRLTPQANRVGFRLQREGGPLSADTAAGTLLSEPIAPGTLQLPPDGQPILLMADRQTVGGYPVLGHVIAADLSKAAQLWPGDRVRFAAVTLAEARAELRRQEESFAMLFGAVT
jgi:biotin-dependent carboxylase-like uncharacterized protein